METHGLMYTWGWYVVKVGGAVMFFMALSALILVIWARNR